MRPSAHSRTEPRPTAYPVGGRKEANPLLGSTFNAESLAGKSGVLGGAILLQRYAIHESPKMRRTLTWLNFAVGAGLGGVAIRNFRFGSGK
jgi:hypothetical protein